MKFGRGQVHLEDLIREVDQLNKLAKLPNPIGFTFGVFFRDNLGNLFSGLTLGSSP
jgi:hypothetical protein